MEAFQTKFCLKLKVAEETRTALNHILESSSNTTENSSTSSTDKRTQAEAARVKSEYALKTIRTVNRNVGALKHPRTSHYFICIVKIANSASPYSLHKPLNHHKIQPCKTLMNKTLAFKQSAKVKLEPSLSLHSLAPY